MYKVVSMDEWESVKFVIPHITTGKGLAHHVSLYLIKAVEDGGTSFVCSSFLSARLSKDK